MIVKLLEDLPVLSGVIFALVALLKDDFKVTGRWLTASSFLIGLILGVGYRYAVAPPVDFLGWFLAVVFGLMAGALACGAYKGIQSATGNAPASLPPQNIEKAQGDVKV
jgi:hypothetical protein